MPKKLISEIPHSTALPPVDLSVGRNVIEEICHPLDRPVWTALTTRQAEFAQIAGTVRRFASAFGSFAASAEGTTDSLAELASLVVPGEQVFLQHGEEIKPPENLVIVRTLPTVQMVAIHTEVASPSFEFEVLTPADAAEMAALARLTKPGPFSNRTGELGYFVGVRRKGRLIAMAGERMKPGSFTEISGVCTHPDHQGQGYAAGLTLEVARAILARGETPFLHAVATNVGAIALYLRLGFVTRWRPVLMVLQRA